MVETAQAPEPRKMRIVVEMELGPSGCPMAPFVENAKFEGELGYGIYVRGEKYPLVTMQANREGLKWLAYRLLKMAYSPPHLAESGLHVHVRDDEYAVEKSAVALQIYFNDKL